MKSKSAFKGSREAIGGVDFEDYEAENEQQNPKERQFA